MDNLEKAAFAGGCFWCLETAFNQQEGVVKAVSGYSGGKEPNPTYRQVVSGQTSHKETVLVTFDPKIISYEKLLDIFWAGIDPTDRKGQFVDRGASYTTAIFYINQRQHEAAKRSLKQLQTKISQPIVTEILPFSTFWPAEDYHQRFAEKEPERYQSYYKASGR